MHWQSVSSVSMIAQNLYLKIDYEINQLRLTVAAKQAIEIISNIVASLSS